MVNQVLSLLKVVMLLSLSVVSLIKVVKNQAGKVLSSKEMKDISMVIQS